MTRRLCPKMHGMLEEKIAKFELQEVPDSAVGREHLYRLVVDLAQDCIYVFGRDLRVEFINPSAAQLFGAPPETLTGKSLDELFPGPDVERMKGNLRAIFESGKAGYFENLFHTFPLGGAWVDSRFVPIRRAGRVHALLGISRDITAAKRHEQDLQDTVEKLERAMEGIVQAMIMTVEFRDPHTAGHERRVCRLACAIAERMQLDAARKKAVQMTAGIHDIGKITVPAEILSKPGRLTELEYRLIQAHPQVSHDILHKIDFPWPMAGIVLQHHERLDGSGYPQGLRGDAICLEARILAVADVVEAMSSHRPYRSSPGLKRALEEIRANRGRLYDPMVVDACLALFKEKAFAFDPQ